MSAYMLQTNLMSEVSDMNPFDKIIGYESIRKELERTADALKNAAYYARLGVSAPRGLLLYGEPGVGKTLMASCLMEASGRKTFVCRKDQPDGAFVNVIRVTFEQAAKETPSIVFLDDMDKFANNDEKHKDSEEYVTVQSCIDTFRHAEVFVLATANDVEDLPESLIRPGRFDRVIEVEAPVGNDAVEIVRHYLKRKACVSDTDAKTIAGIMAHRSCAELETAINKAGLLAGFERSDVITMRHLLLGCFDIVHEVPPDSILVGRKDEKTKKAAYHEAGHALVSELLSPGSVSAVCLYERSGNVLGFTSYFEHDCGELSEVTNAAIRCMGGRMATMQVYGATDLGCSGDIDCALHIISRLTKRHAVFGFHLIDGEYENSPELVSAQEKTVSRQIEACCSQAARLIAENRPLLDALTSELLKKGVLMADDVRRILHAAAPRETKMSYAVL